MDGLLDFLHDLLPASWFESAQEHFGQGLTDDVVAQSVHEASVFFGMDDPINVHEDWTTGVMTNMSWTENDDVLIFSRDQMHEMGITDKEGFDLVMTHEGAHRMLQGMHDITGFDSHQEELCCDYMAGVRAGLNDMDFTKMEASLADSAESESHPGGAARVEAIEAGVEYAHDFMDKYHRAPTFSECLDHFEHTNVYAHASTSDMIVLSPEAESSTLHGYTQGEINDHISKAKHDIAAAESDIRHRKTMIRSKAACGDAYSYEESQLHDAERRLSQAKSELSKWQHEHAEVKSFSDIDSGTESTIGDAINRADDVIARAEALVMENDIDLGIGTSHLSAYSEDDSLHTPEEDHSTLKEMFVNDKNWNSSQAKWYQDKAKVEQHAADLAQQKGDYASMREHNRLAVSYQKMADQYAKDAKASTK